MNRKQANTGAGSGAPRLAAASSSSSFAGFPPLTGGAFSRSLPVYVGAKANVWGMDMVPRERFKKGPDEPEPPPVHIVIPVAVEHVAPVHVLKKLKRERKISTVKKLTPEELRKLEIKMNKLSSFADDGDDVRPHPAPIAGSGSKVRGQTCLRTDSFLTNESSSDDDGGDSPSRAGTGSPGGRRGGSPYRVLRPPSPTDDLAESLGNSVPPLKAAARRKHVLVTTKPVVEGDSKYIPRKVNLPKQMSHLFRTDAAAIVGAAQAEVTDMSYLEIPDWNKYFGEEARLSFLHHYETAYRDLNKVVDGEKNFTKARNSPRTRYLREVARQRLPPLSLLMRKTEDPKGLNISHRGIGDRKMLPLVSIVERLPALNTIILADNRLTDLSLTPLMLKLPTLPGVMHLDLSYNKIDKCSEYLMDYLRDPRCQLQILVLDGADVDDVECTHIADALIVNETLLSLSLKNNKIGTAELQNVATPNFVTGGEGLGRMLLRNKTLLELDISWNYIRLDSACAVAEALITNSTLRVLKIAHNGFGDLGTQVMGMAIKQNTRLQVLDMAFNQVTPKAAAVLQNGLVHNQKINKMTLDGNILGQIGARALVSAIQRASGEGRILRITFVNCDCEKETKGLFDAAAPGGQYDLDLSEPYGQMVAEECLYLLNYRVGCELKRIEYTPKRGQAWKTINLVRERIVHKTEEAPRHMTNFCLTFQDKEKDDETLKALDDLLSCFDLYASYRLTRKILEVIRDLYAEREMLAKTNYQRSVLLSHFEHELLLETFKALFRIADDDCSGEMCIDEFFNCLDSLGVGFEPKYTRRLFVEFDKDNSGNIDEEEFSMIMVNEFCRPDATRGTFVEKHSGQAWPLPGHGFLRIDIEYQCEQAALSDISHDEGILNVISAIRDSRTEAERLVLFDQAISSPYYYMSAQQALMLFEEVSRHVAGNIHVISK
jgi:Ca2+-binding EF-hand superfamily protein/Ran GTPase-activating protein (RanGAP) involved in mRNA processing and transport